MKNVSFDPFSVTTGRLTQLEYEKTELLSELRVDKHSDGFQWLTILVSSNSTIEVEIGVFNGEANICFHKEIQAGPPTDTHKEYQFNNIQFGNGRVIQVHATHLLKDDTTAAATIILSKEKPS